MRVITRREFLRPLLPERGCARWVRLGRVADFPPGTRSAIPGLGTTVVSLREGLCAFESGAYARGDLSSPRPVRLAPDGFLEADLGGRWPARHGLCLMSGERIPLPIQSREDETS
jgi:hypothetical protein